MDALLAAIQSDLKTNLPYLRGVSIIDDELLPPEEIGWPQVGIKDGVWTRDPVPYGKNTESLEARVTVYQSVLLQTPGASIMGEASLGDAGKGAIAIMKEVIARLDRKKLGLPDYFRAHFKSAEASQTIISEGTASLAQKKTLIFEYVRAVAT